MKRGVASTLCGVVLVMLMVISSTNVSKCEAQFVLPPPPFCFPAIYKLRFCITDIYNSIKKGKLKLGVACCKAMDEVELECIVHAIPFSPFTYEDIKSDCRAESSTITSVLGLDDDDDHHQHQQDSAAAAAPSSTEIQLFKKEIDQCLSTIKSIEGCLAEVVKSFVSAQIQILGPACCKAITEVDDRCWPAIFPFNPFFPPLIKDHCNHLLLHVAAAAPLPGGLLPGAEPQAIVGQKLVN